MKKAMGSGFYLEAMFIEYAVIEDRTESILQHAGVFNPEKHNTLARKLNRIADLARGKKALLRKYITVDEIRTWKGERNRLIHALLDQDLSTDELEQIAKKGQRLAKLLCSKATSYRRALERERQNNENGGEI